MALLVCLFFFCPIENYKHRLLEVYVFYSFVYFVRVVHHIKLNVYTRRDREYEYIVHNMNLIFSFHTLRTSKIIMLCIVCIMLCSYLKKQRNTGKIEQWYGQCVVHIMRFINYLGSRLVNMAFLFLRILFVRHISHSTVNGIKDFYFFIVD